MLTLGIETSCDETAVSVLEDAKKIRSNLILSQIEIHKYFGGVIPELASRRHLEVLPGLVDDALSQAGISLKDLNLISVTQGPGLIGALLIGLTYAKSLSYSLGIPLIGVNHIEAHLYSNFMETDKPLTPCIGLIISGGHTTLVKVKNIGRYKVLGQTLDDACGEAFDKVSKLLELGYPGGPIIDRLSQSGDNKTIHFPRAMKKSANYNFSFSGLKTSVVYFIKGYSQFNRKVLKKESYTTEDLVSSFQEAVIDQLLDKTEKAILKTGYKNLILGGGVSRNSRLRLRFKECAKKNNYNIYMPSDIMCTDNAAMIAGLGYFRYNKYGPSKINLDAVPNLGWN